jgi:hypothetical protein
MDVTIFLAKFWGWYLMTFFILLIIYPRRIKQIFEFTKDEKFMFTMSFLAITLGLLNIIVHNLWVADWRIIITLLGWLIFIKGVTRFAFPNISAKWIKKIDFKWFQFLLFLLFIVGMILLNQAYVWVPF